eukprot:Blabericola_migrator_1__11005@NODE_638_length_7121_cov_96_162603_g469_i0_p1_GENE_NODE_638_length_7121_cov_96_162603_g469_i0NODE_638_length_7121_cov_96_162603_g469_i0_p1_ORF_typecomplete_len2066_score356_08RINGv/PF12906_7/8_4e14zfRING_2/PF13639_6/0_053FANCL_C/PF11793_8/0_69_NODE_638_length_7121_cov_96_162603_g469_i08357032
MSREKLCRICRQDASEGPLCHPCRCSGSIRYVHQACLDRWLSRKRTASCELCGAEFRYVKNVAESAPKFVPLREFIRHAWDYYGRGRSHLIRLLFVNSLWGLLLPLAIMTSCRFLLYGLYPPGPFLNHYFEFSRCILLGVLLAAGGVALFVVHSFAHGALSEILRVFSWWRQRRALTIPVANGMTIEAPSRVSTGFSTAMRPPEEPPIVRRRRLSSIPLRPPTPPRRRDDDVQLVWPAWGQARQDDVGDTAGDTAGDTVHQTDTSRDAAVASLEQDNVCNRAANETSDTVCDRVRDTATTDTANDTAPRRTLSSDVTKTSEEALGMRRRRLLSVPVRPATPPRRRNDDVQLVWPAETRQDGVGDTPCDAPCDTAGDTGQQADAVSDAAQGKALPASSTTVAASQPVPQTAPTQETAAPETFLTHFTYVTQDTQLDASFLRGPEAEAGSEPPGPETLEELDSFASRLRRASELQRPLDPIPLDRLGDDRLPEAWPLRVGMPMSDSSDSIIDAEGHITGERPHPTSAVGSSSSNMSLFMESEDEPLGVTRRPRPGSQLGSRSGSRRSSQQSVLSLLAENLRAEWRPSVPSHTEAPAAEGANVPPRQSSNVSESSHNSGHPESSNTSNHPPVPSEGSIPYGRLDEPPRPSTGPATQTPPIDAGGNRRPTQEDEDENPDVELLMWAGLVGPPYRAFLCAGFLWLGSMLFLIPFFFIPYKLGETVLHHQLTQAASSTINIHNIMPLGAIHFQESLNQQIAYQDQVFDKPMAAPDLIYNLTSYEAQDKLRVTVNNMSRPRFSLSSARSLSAWYSFICHLPIDILAFKTSKDKSDFFLNTRVTDVSLHPDVMRPFPPDSVLEVTEDLISVTLFDSPWTQFHPVTTDIRTVQFPSLVIDLQDESRQDTWFASLQDIFGDREMPHVTEETLERVAHIHKVQEIGKRFNIKGPRLTGALADAHWYSTPRAPLRPWHHEAPPEPQNIWNFVLDTIGLTQVVPALKHPASVAVLGQGSIHLTCLGASLSQPLKYWVLGRMVVTHELESSGSVWSRVKTADRFLASYEYRVVVSPIPTPHASKAWVGVVFLVGLLRQGSHLKLSMYIISCVVGFISGILCRKLGAPGPVTIVCQTGRLRRMIASWISLMIDAVYFTISFMEIASKVFIVLFCKVGVPLTVGFCLIRLGSCSPWLDLDSEWVTSHIDANPFFVVVTAHLLGWLHTFCVSSVALRVLDTMDLRVAGRVLMNDRITLSFFTFNFAVLASVADVKQMLLAPSDLSDESLPPPPSTNTAEWRDPETGSATWNVPPAPGLNDFRWLMTDRVLDDASEDLLSKIYRLMAAYFSTAPWHAFLEGLLVFMWLHVIAAAVSVMITGFSIRFLCPNVLPFRLMVHADSPQVLLSPWGAYGIKLLLGVKRLAWDFEVETSDPVMSVTSLCVRVFVVCSLGAFWFKCLFRLEPPPRLHAMTSFTVLAMRLGGFSDYLKPELQGGEEEPRVINASAMPSLDLEEGLALPIDRSPISSNMANVISYQHTAHEWRRRELTFVISKDIEALFIGYDDSLVGLDYKRDGQTVKHDCVAGLDRSKFVVCGVFVASRVETNGPISSEEDVMFKVYMPLMDVPNTSLSNIRFAASKIFVIHDRCSCLKSDDTIKWMQFPRRARGFFMGDADGSHYIFRYVSVHAPYTYSEPVTVWRPLPRSKTWWKIPAVPALLLCVAMAMAVCLSMALPLVIGRLVFCALLKRPLTFRHDAVGPIRRVTWESIASSVSQDTVYYRLQNLPHTVFGLVWETTEYTDLVTFVLGCTSLWLCINLVKICMGLRSSFANVSRGIQRTHGNWLRFVSKLVAFTFGMLFVTLLIPILQGAVLDLLVIRPDVWRRFDDYESGRLIPTTLQWLVQWLIVGIVPCVAWFSLLYLTQFSTWVHPVPFLGAAIVPPHAIQAISILVRVHRGWSVGVTVNRRKLRLLYQSLILPLMGDFAFIILQPLLISMIGYYLGSVLSGVKSWHSKLCSHPMGVFVLVRFFGWVISVGFWELKTLHTTVWQERYVVTTLLCNSDGTLHTTEDDESDDSTHEQHDVFP